MPDNARPLPASAKDWIRLFRLPNAVVAGLGVWLGHACLAREAGSLDVQGAALGSLAMALLAAAGNAHNDVLDLEADRVNRPDRPLPAGRIRPASALRAALALGLAAVALAAALGPAQGALAAAMAGLLYAYNARLKALPLLGNLAVSLLCALAVYLPAAPGRPAGTLIPILFAFLTTMARELAKDAEDISGDRSVGWRTFPIAAGIPATRLATGLFLAATLLLLPAPFLWMGYHPIYGVLALAGPAPLLVRNMFELRFPEPPWGRIQRTLKWTMLAGMLAILAGVLL